MKRRQITTEEDIKLLVDSFYSKVVEDETIGFIFTDVANLNFPEHMPIMYNFWNTVLLGSKQYKGSPMEKHFALNELYPLKKLHFDQWLKLWFETIDSMFIGEIAEEAKNRATVIAKLMEFKMRDSN